MPSPYQLQCKENIYTSFDNGPFVLYVETLGPNEKVHTMAVGKLIKDHCFSIYKNVDSLLKIDKRRIKVTLDNYNSANALKNKQFRESKNLICFIPRFMFFRQGLIRDIDYSITEDDILGYGVSDVEIAKVRRLNYLKIDKILQDI